MGDSKIIFEFNVTGGDRIVVNPLIVRKSLFISGITEILTETDGKQIIDVMDKISKITITLLNGYYTEIMQMSEHDLERILYMIYKSYPHTAPLRIMKGTETEIVDTPMTIKEPNDIYMRKLIYITDGDIHEQLNMLRKYCEWNGTIDEFIIAINALMEVSYLCGCDEFRGYIIYRIAQQLVREYHNKESHKKYEQCIAYIKTLTEGDIAEIIDAIPFKHTEKIADDIYGEHDVDYEFLDEHKFDEMKDAKKSDEERTKRINLSIKHKMVKRYGYNEYFIYNVIANGTLDELKMCHNEDVNIEYILQEIFVAIINGRIELMNYLLERLRYVKHTHTRVEPNILRCQNSGTISANTYVHEEKQGTTDSFVPTDNDERTYQDTDERDDKTMMCYDMFVQNVKQEKGRIRDDEFEELCKLITTHSNSYNLIKKYIGYNGFNKIDRVIERAVSGYRFRIMHEIFSRGAIVDKIDNTPYYSYNIAGTNDVRLFDAVYGYVCRDRFACDYLISTSIIMCTYDIYAKAMECGLWKALAGTTGQEIYDHSQSLFELADRILIKEPNDVKRRNLDRIKEHFETHKELIISYVPNRKDIFSTNL